MNKMNRRAMSFLLALAMILSMIPSNVFTVFAADGDEESASATQVESAKNEYEANVGKQAMFNISVFFNFAVDDDPATFDDDFYSEDWDNPNYVYYYDGGSDPTQAQYDFDAYLTMEIIDYHYNPTTYGLWYKVKAVDGYTLPALMEENPWVFFNWTDIYEDPELAAMYLDSLIIMDGTNKVYDSNGNLSAAITLPQYEKPEYSAVSSFSSLTADVAYQWQIEYEYGQWVDIYGENGETINLSYGIVAQLLNESNFVYIRCKSTAGSKTAYSAAIPVTLLWYEPGEENGVESEENTEPAEPAAYNLRAARNASAYDVMPMAEGDSQIATTYNVIIQYLFEDGKQAYAPWSATIIAGQTIQQTVKSPDVIGYAPDQATVELNQTVTGPITITVTYKPVDVKVTIQHLFQPVNGSNNFDDYIRAEGIQDEVIYRPTGSQIGGGLALSGDEVPAGFYALRYDETTVVAATGNTVIKIYYDRIFYLMNFDLDGGYGAEPIYARVGTPLNGLIKTPTKPGYAFTGWKASDGQAYKVDSFPYSTMPAANTSFVAQWTAGDTTFDIVFWYENADDDGYTQVGAALDNAATAGEKVNGSTYKDTSFSGRDDTHFTYSHADEDVIIKGDGSSVVNVYFTRNVYTMTFEIDDTSLCDVEEHRHTASCGALVCTKTEHDHAALGCALNCKHTSHDLSCYEGQYDGSLESISKPNNSLTNLGNGIYSYRTYGSTYYVLNIGDQWYENEYGGRYSISLVCSHSHDDSCYGCNQVGHIHSSDCYKYTCGEYEHYHVDGTCYYIVVAKYDADISDVWLSDPVKAVMDNGDAFQWDMTDAQVSFMEKMPGSDSTMTRYEYGGRRTYHWYYYLEVLPNQSTTGLTTKVHDGKTYYEYDDRIINYSNTLYLTYDDDYYPITGFEQLYGKTEGGWYSYGSSYRLDFKSNSTSGEYEAFLYYTRESYTLTFSNYGSVVSEKGGTFLFEEDISKSNFIPDYPAALEPGAYVFEGWYESPFFGDTKFDFTGATMPAHNVTLYARWVPKEHTVNIYLKDDLTNQIGTQKVPHRDTATNLYPDSNNPPKHPDSDKYQFVGWFYMDGDTEKAFDFSMPVTKDLDLYAKWSSNVLVDYTVYYKLQGTDTEIAAPTTGQALAGTGKTFTAKNGEELYSDYQTGYFPAAQSDFKMDMTVEGPNTYTFYYEAAKEVSYTVKYLEYGTDLELIPSVTRTTSSAIVTENFVIIPKYMPDAYSKTAVVTADGKTEIIFYYTKDEVHAPVHIVHMTQNAVGDGYTIYQEYTDLNGEIGKTYTATILNITGFDFARATAAAVGVTPSGSSVTGTVTENGLEIVIYYDREIYNYEFQFLEQGTNTPLADPVTGFGRYNATVGQNALNISGYDCISGDYQTITIQIDTADGTKNIKVFYYVEKTVDIRYETIGPAGAGYVTPQQEVQVPVKTGTVSGSVVTINPGYKFIGWFYDEQCTQPVKGDGWLNGTTIIPQKNSDGLYESATYYAKFDYDLTSLTIVKDGAEKWEDIDSNQTFIFDIYDGNTLVTTVTVHAGTNWKVVIEGLTVGKTYRIVERTDWSWRYNCSGWTHTNGGSGTNTNEATITLGLDGTITFTNTRGQDKWLDGDAWCDNIFKKN